MMHHDHQRGREKEREVLNSYFWNLPPDAQPLNPKPYNPSP